MAENKRYYWLKFKEDFFSSKRIKKLRKLGADYLIIYLKMQLKALKTEGYLYITGIEDNIADEIALDIDEDADKVQLTLSYLQACNLLEISEDGVLFLPYVEILTDSESQEAIAKRRQRANKKLQIEDKQRTMSGQSPPEIDIEKEIEIDIEKKIEKKKKNKKPIVYYPNDERLNQAFIDYVDMRKKIKAPMTDRAIALAINKLADLSQGNNDKAIEILNQSIMNSWKGLFELKGTVSSSQSVMDEWANA